MIDYLINKIDELQIKLNDAEKEIKQYKETLCKCSPLYLSDVCGFCVFCQQEIDEGFYGHSDDCKYVRLCATDINVATKDEVLNET